MIITFLGGGKMARALIAGLKSIPNKGVIQVIEPEEQIRISLKEDFNISTLDENVDIQYKNFIPDSDILILSIKPQIFSAISNNFRDYISEHQTILSIMAGINISTINESLNSKKIIRIMPNTPVQIKAGMSMWTSSKYVDQKSKIFCRILLESIGNEIYTSDENHLDIATAISGSGPAYVFLMIESLVESGVKLGLKSEIALKLATQTVFGAGKLALCSEETPKQLRKNVTSPGGTTEAGVNSMLRSGLDQSIVEGVKAAFEKSIELGVSKN